MHSRLHSMFVYCAHQSGWLEHMCMHGCAGMVVQAVLCMPSPRNVLLHKLKLRMRRSLDIKIAEVPTLKIETSAYDLIFDRMNTLYNTGNQM